VKVLHRSKCGIVFTWLFWICKCPTGEAQAVHDLIDWKQCATIHSLCVLRGGKTQYRARDVRRDHHMGGLTMTTLMHKQDGSVSVTTVYAQQALLHEYAVWK
jgi:hypothetical protein